MDAATLEKYRKLGQNISLLYVEDDPVIQHEVYGYIKRLIGDVQIVSDGREGLEAFKKRSFDIVMTDIVMPNMDGLEMIKAIKEIRPDQTVLVTSSYNENDKLMKCIDLGVDRFVVKPFDADELLQALFEGAILQGRKVIEYVEKKRDILEYREKFEQLKTTILELLAKHRYRFERYGQEFSALLVYTKVQRFDMEKCRGLIRLSDELFEMGDNMMLVVFEQTDEVSGFKAAENFRYAYERLDLNRELFCAFAPIREKDTAIDIASRLLVILDYALSDPMPNAVLDLEHIRQV